MPVETTGTAAAARRIALVTAALDPAGVEALVATTAAGARVVFAGVVRRHNLGREVLRLHYEAYEPMALRVLEAIAGEARARPGVLDVAVHHRLGTLELGETAVVVAVAAEHRAEAFAACRHVIDELKARAPIWKKEIYRDGESWLGHHP